MKVKSKKQIESNIQEQHQLKVNKNDGRDKYRKKNYTPKIISQDSRSKSLLKTYEEKYNNLLKIEKLLNADTILNNGKVKETYSGIPSAKEVYKILIDAAEKGLGIDMLYDLPVSNKELHHCVSDFPLIGLINKDGILNKDMPEILNNFKEKKRREFIKKEKVTMNAVAWLCNLPLLPENSIHPDTSVEVINSTNINKELTSLQAKLKPIINFYLDFLAMGDADYMFRHWGLKNPRMWIKKKYKTPKQEASSVLNEIVVNLVDKFKGIGYSDNEAYKRTAKLLHYFYPHLCSKDPDLVRQRYQYTLKKTSKKTQKIISSISV